ncbi:MAG: hypothetical protein M1586_02020 [Patescibacteria group bacterium]|nr:hypothetical protein [Patescibacteria group bacterium]MCL5262058.1 hypothetical protein [Patescibacteria group bacterium]
MRYARVSEALKELRRLGGVEELQRALYPQERLELLVKYLPQIRGWPPFPARELVFRLQRDEKVDMGVCSFYSLSDDKEDEEQYCLHGGGKVSCLCPQPWQGLCVIRDADRQMMMMSFGPSVEA